MRIDFDKPQRFWARWRNPQGRLCCGWIKFVSVSFKAPCLFPEVEED